jgi:hypothetical protein
LWILPLVLGGIGHCESKPVDQFRVATFRQPILLGLGFGVLSNRASQFVQRLFIELGSCAAIVTGVLSRHRQTEQLSMSDDACHSGLTRRHFPILQNLAEEGPQHRGGTVDRTKAKQAAVFGKHFFGELGREHLGKGKPRLFEEDCNELLKTVTASPRRMWYRPTHEKTLLGFSLTSDQGGLSFLRQARALNFNLRQTSERISKLLDSVNRTVVRQLN